MTYYIEQGKLKHTHHFNKILSIQYENHIFKKIFENMRNFTAIESVVDDYRYLSINHNTITSDDVNSSILIDITNFLRKDEEILLICCCLISTGGLSICLLLDSNSVVSIDIVDKSMINSCRINDITDITKYAISIMNLYTRGYYEIYIQYDNHRRKYRKNDSTNEINFIEEIDSETHIYTKFNDILSRSIQTDLCDCGEYIIFIALSINGTLNIYEFDKSKKFINLISTKDEINSCSKISINEDYIPYIYIHSEGKIYLLYLNLTKLDFITCAIDVIFPISELPYKPRIVNVKKAIQ